MPSYTDQLNRNIQLPSPPKRIVSLVPSQTELLFDLGLEEEVIGLTKFCVHPAKWFREKERVGGTKTVNIEKIKALRPDLIVANKEENVKEQIEKLAHEFPVWISDVCTLEDAYGMMSSIGELTGRRDKASALVTSIRTNFTKLDRPTFKVKTAYLIWKDPYMTVGGDTFIHQMLETAGFQNMFASSNRYPEVSVKELQASTIEVLFLSSEPYPFKQTHIDELQQELPQTKILLVDGEMFSWYGSRLLHAAAYFERLQKQVAAVA